MNLTYEVTSDGYKIFNNGKLWIDQKGYIPYPGPKGTMEEAAQNHIAEINKNHEAAANAPAPVDGAEVAQLESDFDTLSAAFAELTAIVAGAANGAVDEPTV